MDLMTITAIDKHSSDTMSRTFTIKNKEQLKDAIEDFERELLFSRYELMTDELIDDYDVDIVELLDELEITY